MTTISIRVPDPARLTSTTACARGTSVWTRLVRVLQSTWCVVNGGHYKVLHTEPERMALRCVACGHTSPGWVVGSPRRARSIPGDPDRLRAERGRLVA